VLQIGFVSQSAHHEYCWKASEQGVPAKPCLLGSVSEIPFATLRLNGIYTASGVETAALKTVAALQIMKRKHIFIFANY
jgi:hypothetical protein